MLGLANGLTNTSYQWQPNMVDANMVLWLRNGVGVEQGQWADSSGNGRHITQATGGDQATVVEGGLNFEQSEADHYDITGSDVVIDGGEYFAMFLVCTIESYDGTQNTVLGTSATATFFEFQSDRRIRFKTNATSTTDIIQYEEDTFVAEQKMVLAIERLAGGTGLVKTYKNGTLLIVESTPTGDGNNNGAITFNAVGMRKDDRHFDGTIHEMIVYDTANLAATDIVKINNYLKNKHGL